MQPNTAVHPKNYGFSELTPRIWHGMTLSAWWGLVRGNFQKIATKRYPLALSITVFALLNSCCALLSTLINSRRIKRTEFVGSPVFILGFWRSGTTWLNELMVRDHRHAYPTTFQCFAPETFLLTRILSGIFDFLIPKKRPMDNVKLAMGNPQEEEFAMLNMGYSTPYRRIAFPTEIENEAHTTRPEKLSSAMRKKWVSAWIQFLRTIQFVNPGKRLVIKSPLNTCRVRMIKEQFPNAKFIHICRDPYALLYSNIKVNKAMTATQSLELIIGSDEDISDTTIKALSDIYKVFFCDLDKLDPSQICMVKYEDLREDPEKEIRRIYEHLDLGELEPVLKPLKEFISHKKHYQPQEYSLNENDRIKIEAEWEPYFSEFGYETRSRSFSNQDRRQNS